MPDTIPGVLRRAAALWPDAEALVEGDVRITFREYEAQARRVARGLVAKGVEPGDRVAMWLPNTWETAVVAMGVHCAGATLVPINTRFKAAEMAQVVRRAGARVLFVPGDFLGIDYLAMVAEAGLIAQLATTVLVGGRSDPRAVPFAELLAAGDDVPESVVERRCAAIGPCTVSDVLFTSGTTGTPKGVMLCHGAGVRAYVAYNESLGLRPGDRVLGIAPFFHCFGLKAGVLSAAIDGATLIPQAVFDVARTVELIGSERVTVLPAPPPVWLGLLDDHRIDRSKLATVRVAIVGAARFSTQDFRRIRDELGIPHLAPGYGLTEAHAAVTRCCWDDDFETVSTTSGYPIPGVELRIVDGEGVDLPTGHEGEILVRGYQLMLGYLDDPEATATTIDPEGWLHTGDVGRIDERGRLSVTDRKKDMFVVGGFNAYPAEIERILLGHPAIGDVAVIGVPDERMGEVGKAYVTVRDGCRIDADEVLAWARQAMANYKVPRSVEIVDDLPRSATGKALKHVLRARALGMPT